jgi:xylulokinase
MDQRVLLGIDLGTSGLKAVLFDSAGACLAEASRELPLRCPRQGWVEQDPDRWWNALCELLPALRARAPEPMSRLAVIACTGQQSSPVLLDRQGGVLTPSPIWMDRRATLECRELEERFGSDELYRATGLRPDPMYTVYKLMWLRKHAAKVWRETALVLQPKDFINYRLTGLAAADYAGAAGTQCLHLAELNWHQGILSAAGIEPSLFPGLFASSHVLGPVKNGLAKALGLPPAVPVVAGGGDTTVSALGCGVSQPGDGAVVVGTSSDVVICLEDPVTDPLRRIGCYPYCLPGRFMAIAGSNNAGAVVNWCRDTFFEREKGEAEKRGQSGLDLMLEGAATIPPGSEGLVCLPYFSGERSPIYNPDARGLLSGLSLLHTKNHVARAILEGITLSVYERLKVTEALHLPLDRILLTGGGVRNAFWRQMITDVLGRPTYHAEAQQAASLGAAMLGAAGAGMYPSVHAACREMAPAVRETLPNPEHKAAYERLFRRFTALYRGNREFFGSAGRARRAGKS